MATAKKGTSPRKSVKRATSGAGEQPTGLAAPAEQSNNHYSLSLEEEIRRRAYEIYEERGRRDGMHHEDWIRAEAEVRDRRSTQRSA
jgi:hypothetical protein